MAQLVWLVTGCSSGFGETFVHEIIARGDKVIATGRQAETRLVYLKDIGATVLDLDVGSTQAELDKKIEEAITIYGKVDVLVNNAGYAEFILDEDINQETWHTQFDVNFFGQANVTCALLPHLRRRKYGKIVFMNSIFSHIAPPECSAYSSTKHALDEACSRRYDEGPYAEALSAEIAQFGIQVISFSLGNFRTKLIAQMKHSPPVIMDYSPLFAGLTEMFKSMDGNQPGEPRKGIERMIDVVRQEGVAKGKEIPVCLPLGSDALAIIRDKCQSLLKTCDEWEDVILSTDFDESKQGYWAEQEANAGKS